MLDFMLPSLRNSQKIEESKVEEIISYLANSLVKIVTICYSDFATRSQKQLIRLYNQCFLFCLLCKTVIGNPQKLTVQKFYGNHFLNITVHVPETALLFSLKSIVPEKEERSFGTLRRLSENITNRQPKYVVDTPCLECNFKPLIVILQRQLPNKIQQLASRLNYFLLISGLFWIQHCWRNFPCWFKITWNPFQFSFFLLKMSGGRWMLRAWLSMMAQAMTISD